jgi:hypothetical protein
LYPLTRIVKFSNTTPAFSHKHLSTPNPKTTSKMHYLVLASALLATSSISLAAPLAEADWSPVPEWQNWKKAKKSPFQFTSTYLVTATPDQVINSTGTPTPGQPGAIGYFNYGINSDLDIICYVCPLHLSRIPFCFLFMCVAYFFV